MTGVKEVADALLAQKLHCQWITPTHQDYVGALERALLSTEKRRHRESQVVVGLMRIHQFQQSIKHMTSEHDIARLKLDVHRTLLDYVNELEGHLANNGEEYIFFTTRGVFERVTHGYKSMPLLEDVKHAFGFTLSVGVGFGQTANEAGAHARIALRQANDEGGHQCFIVTEDKRIVGPVDTAAPLVYPTAVTDEGLLKKAEAAGMNAVHMQKLMAQVARFDKTHYTATELADVLGVTLRSTHRILLRWLDADLVQTAGVEKTTTRGRPRQVYVLGFLE
ncbi:hypothetical protein G4V62_17995 [Bacillaceae bacterium SIJ1]|uniref:hypothetical protein n=1 Tax=Litoribacterium kuwaitense TaxID=1398745 RepID=UPI0013E9D3E8|nr:hypothetical protein [Litoribacterium kuwaitense]NGP46743.1 hypothetical protein [Litoribacterium kuwaitense]